MEYMQNPVVSPAAMQTPFPSVMPAAQGMPLSNMPQQVSPVYDIAYAKQLPVAGAYHHMHHHMPHHTHHHKHHHKPCLDTGIILVLFILLVIVSCGRL